MCIETIHHVVKFCDLFLVSVVSDENTDNVIAYFF
jgi:hypothetical protein